MIKTIPLGKLVASPRNVRRSSDPTADAQLQADIEARGLLQNLVVSACSRPRGSFAVEAGGRRLAALKQLLCDGKLAKDHEVCCLVIEDADGAQEASLAENFQRLSMNPADECVAFQQLVEQGSDHDGIARRFGLSTRFVEGRLRLAALAPAIFEALGAGEISLDLAKAYAASSDHERQLYVFELMSRGYGSPHPDSVRRMMTQATMSASDRRARFVGEDAYVAAGGRIEHDLFSDASEARWLDVALLERLASERLAELAAEKQAETGLGFVRATLDRWIDCSQLEDLRRVPVERPSPTDEESAMLDALEAELDDLADVIDDEDLDEDARADAEARVRDLNERIETIVSKPPLIDDALKPQLGAFLMLDEEGSPRLDRNFYAQLDCDIGVPLSDDEHERPIAASERATKPAGLSQRLVDELAVQRRDVLAVHLAADPSLAHDLAIFLMVEREAGYCFERSGSSLSASPPSDPVFDLKTPDAPASLAAAEASETLDRTWVAGANRQARFDAFRLMSEQARSAWLGFAMARTLEASLNLPGKHCCPFQDHLGQLLRIDIARWWRPTGANFFDRVSKNVALEALAAVGGPELAALHAKSKKAELAQSCERIFAGDFVAEPAVKAAALAWVPDVMRFAEPAPFENSVGDDQGDEAVGDPMPEREEDSAAEELEEVF